VLRTLDLHFSVIWKSTEIHNRLKSKHKSKQLILTKVIQSKTQNTEAFASLNKLHEKRNRKYFTKKH